MGQAAASNDDEPIGGRLMERHDDAIHRQIMHQILRMLEQWGLINHHRAERTLGLVWPRILTGFARVSQRVADIAMVGMVLGPSAIAGIAYANAFWQIGNVFALGLSGGTVSLVSRQYGAGQFADVERSIKQSALVGAVLSIPLAISFWYGTGYLVGLLSGTPATTKFGTIYLQVMSLGILFVFLNKIGSRALIGADDARTPMIVRSLGAALNVCLNAIFVFVLDLGVRGVAIGTVLSLALVTAIFTYGFLTGHLPGLGELPIRVSLADDLRTDIGQVRELITISVPLVARRLVPVVAVVPVLGLAGTFGPAVVAGLEISRRIRKLSSAPNWGFSLASSSLVGQHLGNAEPATAGEYAWGILRFSTVVNICIAVAVFVLAEPIAALFIDQPRIFDRTVPFVRVAAIGVVGLGIDKTTTGVLRSSGDTVWPFYGKVAYLFVIPIAAFAAAPFGITALYALLVAETALPALFTFYRFQTGRWKATGDPPRSSCSR